MKTKKEMYNQAVRLWAESVGGASELIKLFKEWQKRGEITPKQAYDLRQGVDEACKVKDESLDKEDLINELNKKVVEALKYYR